MPGPVESGRNSLVGIALGCSLSVDWSWVWHRCHMPLANTPMKEGPTRKAGPSSNQGTTGDYATILLRRRRAAPKMPISPVARSVIDAGSGVATIAWMLVGFAALLTPIA